MLLPIGRTNETIAIAALVGCPVCESGLGYGSIVCDTR